MRTLLAAALLFGLTACSSADDKKAAPTAANEPDKKKDEPKQLKVGDVAPPLRADKWLNGEALPAYAEGKVYVVDFWATWCGPCIQMMPHLAELQSEYKDQGLVVVAATSIDRRNPLDAVEKFVKRRGPKLGFRFAVAESDYLETAYMEASGSDSLPTTFVIDKAGKIAYIGHPMQLGDVLPKVLAGTWRGQADIDAIAKANEELGAVFDKAEKDPQAGLKALAEYEAKYPEKAKQAMVQVSKLVLLVQAKQYDEAKTLTESLLPTLTEKKNTRMLNNIRAVWSDKDLNPDRKHVALAVQAAEALLKIEGDKDPMALIALADAHSAAGNKAKAVEFAEKAIAAAEDEDQKAFFQKQLEQYKK